MDIIITSNELSSIKFFQSVYKFILYFIFFDNFFALYNFLSHKDVTFPYLPKFINLFFPINPHPIIPI